MNGVEDRSISLIQYLAYCDGNVVEVFANEKPGKISTEARGGDEKNPSKNVIVLDSDNGRTLAEVFNQGYEAVTERYKNSNDVWHSFIEWHEKESIR